jgi:hypothetical protein
MRRLGVLRPRLRGERRCHLGEHHGDSGNPGRGREYYGAAGRRASGSAVHQRLRALLLLQGITLIALRQFQAARADSREAESSLGLWAIWLLTHVQWLPGRARGRRLAAVRGRRTYRLLATRLITPDPAPDRVPLAAPAH